MNKMPQFTEEQIYEMTKYVIKEVKRRFGKISQRKLIEGIDDEGDEFGTPHVECLTDACNYIQPARLLSEFDSYLGHEKAQELINNIIDEWEAEEFQVNRDDFQYLNDLTEYLSPEDILSQADNYFGLWDTKKWANDIVDIIWNNEPQYIL